MTYIPTPEKIAAAARMNEERLAIVDRVEKRWQEKEAIRKGILFEKKPRKKR